LELQQEAYRWHDKCWDEYCIPTYIFIDGLELLTDDGLFFGDRQLELRNLLFLLKELAKKPQTIVMLSYQPEEETSLPAELAELPDVVMTLQMPKRSCADPHNPHETAEVIVTKNHDDALGSISLEYDRQQMYFPNTGDSIINSLADRHTGSVPSQYTYK
jgi:replicative DNA helicase